MKKIVLLPLLLHALCVFSQNAFPIVSADHGSAGIYADSTDHWLVNKAAALLQDDIQRITGKRLPLFHSLPTQTIQLWIIIGSLDKNPVIRQLAKANRIPAGRIDGKWESYLLRTVRTPLPNI